MKVLLTGATGLLGGALLELLLAEGHEVRCLVREGAPAPRAWTCAAPSSPAGTRPTRALSRALSGVARIARRGVEYAPPVVERRAGRGWGGSLW